MGRSKAASAQLEETNNVIDSNFVFIQEPYIVQNKIIGIPLRNTIIASPNKPKCAIIIRDKACSVFTLLVQPDIVAIQCSYQEIDIILVCVYISPTSDFDIALTTLNNFLISQQNKYLIIGGDFNAKHEIWGGLIIDERGEKLIELLILHNLFIINEKNSTPTFSSANGQSWIDITAVSGGLISKVTH